MKPLLLVTELEDYTISFANGIARHSPVILGVPARRYAKLVRWLEPGVDVRLLEWPRHCSLANPSFLVSLTRLIRRERPSVIHLLSNTTFWLNFAAPFWRPIPVITTVHDVEVHPGDRDTRVLPSWATNLIVRQSRDIVVHGETLKSRAAARFSKQPDHVHVLSHPAIIRYGELARAEGLKPCETDRPFTLLMFGRIFAYKGLEQLIRAESKLQVERLPDLRFVIAGRGDDPWALRHLMRCQDRYDIRNRFIEDREVAQLFLDADVVVLPYTEASQSGVLNLAAAFGKPVIVTDVGELRATVEDSRIGLVIQPNDPDQLAAAIARLHSSPQLRADLGSNARAWAEGPNAPAAVGAKAVDLYKAVMNACG
jgi:glycosyltransferase involved in cell wall biosynthesis